MKKIISLLLALMLICTFCTPAFAAEDEPIELVPNQGGSIGIADGKRYIISSGDYTVDLFNVLNGTLTIGKDAKVTVAGAVEVEYLGTVNVLGQLVIANSDAEYYNRGMIRVTEAGCCRGKIVERRVIKGNSYKYVPHIFENGVCIVCGKACENEFHNGKYTCPDCGMVVDTSATGSILSQGYPEIVYGIGGIAVGFIAAMLIFRKKKVSVSSTAADDEE